MTNNSAMQELLSKLSNHADLVSKGIDSDNAIRATFGEEILESSGHLIEAIHELDQRFKKYDN